MKKSMLLVSLLCAPLMAAHAKPAKKVAAKSSGVVWRTNFDAALKEAKQSGKPVFIDFYTDWCGACKYLDQTTYHDAKFVRASRNWVMVKVNAEKGARNTQIASKYKVNAYPTLLMLDMRGQKLNQVAGAYPTDMMISEMQKATKKMGVLSAQNATMRVVG
ncbi:thioredoxin 1 [Abditibacteriota bacterium]|nr:thioredoxin 1 [Abditibacteriota bacterium]